VPLDPAELRRGKIVWAVYPFAAEFPAEILDGRNQVTVNSVDDYAKLRRGQPTKLVTEVRLRPVLLLHDGTRGDHEDVACLRINTVKPKHRQSKGTWKRITDHEHSFFFHLPKGGSHGLREESVISLTSIGTVHKSAIANLRPAGSLNDRDMQIISERLRGALSLDLARQLAEQARELLRRAGVLEE
jgi:hypothetical protein